MNVLVTIPKGEIFDTFVPPLAQTRLENLGKVEYNETSEQFTPEELAERLRNKDVAVTGWGTELFDEKVLEGNDRLKIIAHTGGTVQGIACDATYDKGIRILSGNDVYAESVAEGTIAYMLTALRKIPDFVNSMRGGDWDKSTCLEGLLEQKVGLVGYGMITRHLVKMLKPFHCNVLVYSSHVSDEELLENSITRASLDEIFSTCKVVSLHSALTPKTHHIINRKLLEMLDSEAILINTARGAIVDEEALGELLAQNRFRAVLDVFGQEPLPPNSPLRSLPNAYLIPHWGGPTPDRRKCVTLRLVDDIENFFAGRPLKLEITQQYAGYMTQPTQDVKT